MADREPIYPVREPPGRSDRPTGDMNSPDRSRTDHETHELLLVAALAAGDVHARDRSRAELQAATCAECAALRDELRAIAAATQRLPAPTRTREFTLTPDDAARVRRPSLRRIVLELAGPRGLIGRPLATAVTSLGVAGIILTSAAGIVGSFGFLGAAGSAPALIGAQAPSDMRALGTPLPEGAAGAESGAPLGPTGQTPSSDTASGLDGGRSAPPGVQGLGGAPTPVASPDGQDLKASRDDAGSGPSPLVLVSFGLVALGLALFVLRRIAARLA